MEAKADVAVTFLSFLRSSIAIRDDIERFHGDLKCVFVALFLTSMGALAQRQFTVEQFFREAVIIHADNVTGSTKL